MDVETRRAEDVVELTAAAERRFGPSRAAALQPTIEDVARWMAEVAMFPLDADEAPAFYAEPAS